MKKILLGNLPAILSVVVVIIAGLICSVIQPTCSFAIINVEEYHYPWYFWIVTCSLLALPLISLVRSEAFRQGQWYERFLWCSLAMLAISTMHQPRLYIDIQAVLFAAVAGYAIWHKPFGWHRLTVPHYFILAYLMWNIISLFWSVCPSYGTTLINHLVPLLLYPLCFLFFSLKQDILQRILLAFWYGVLIAMVMTIVCACYEIRILGLPITDLLSSQKLIFHNADHSIECFAFQMAFAWSGTDHPSYNAIWLIAGLIITFYLTKEKILSLGSSIIGIALNLLTTIIIQSRIGVVMSALALAIGIVYLAHNKKRMLYAYATLALCAGVYLSIDSSLLARFLHDPTRAAMFQADYTYLSQDHWWGCGIGGMTAEYMRSMVPDLPPYDFEHWYPHNQLIGDWMQTGIIGLILSLGLYVSTLVVAIRRRRFTAILFLLCMGLHACIEMPLRFLSGVTMVALYCCLFMVRLEPAPDTIPDSAACDSAS